MGVEVEDADIATVAAHPLALQAIDERLGEEREWAGADERVLVLAAGADDHAALAGAEQRSSDLRRQRGAGRRLFAWGQDGRELTRMASVDDEQQAFCLDRP